MNLIDSVQVDAMVCTIVEIAENHRPDVDIGFDWVIKTCNPIRNNKSGRVEFPSGGYKRSIKVPIFEEGHESANEPKYIRIYIDPYDPGKAFVKLALNKHPYQKEHYLLVNGILQKLFKFCSYNYLQANHVYVKKIDIAIDKNVNIRFLWFDKSRAQVSILVFNRKGELETIYLGKNSSDKQSRIYDKNAQLKSRKHKHLADKKLLRIEFSYRPDCRIDKVFEEINLINELKSFSVYKAKAVKNAKIFSDEVWSIIQYVGLKAVLQSMTQSNRRRARTQLKGCKTKLISSKVLAANIRILQEDLSCLIDAEVHF